MSMIQERARLILSTEQENELHKVFEERDPDGSGTIDIGAFAKVAIDLGEPLSIEELEQIRRELDTENTGVISFESFLNWWTFDGLH